MLRKRLSTNCEGEPDPIGGRIVAGYDWLRSHREIGPDDGLADDRPERVFRDAISLQAILAAAVAGLVLYVQRSPQPTWCVALLFVAIACLPLHGLYSICWARQDFAGEERYVYSKAVREFGRRALLISIAIVVVVTFSYRKGWLPGQRRAAKATNATMDSFSPPPVQCLVNSRFTGRSA